MANNLVISEVNSLAVSGNFDLSKMIKPLQKELFLLDTYIAGTMYIEDKSIFEDLKDGECLTLKREPKNRFDKKAILVLDNQKRKLGYVPEKDNAVFSRLMDGGKMLFCKVKGKEDMGLKMHVDIEIYLEDF
ncbi:MAG: HIRAN domain-containing protein [Lachnospiraceae bacterium]|nr:HIRAN domain-containing protein [Lachnospiraceae bacterium]